MLHVGFLMCVYLWMWLGGVVSSLSSLGLLGETCVCGFIAHVTCRWGGILKLKKIKGLWFLYWYCIILGCFC